jgi:ADP-heptose:LPS heptosyltransferase
MPAYILIVHRGALGDFILTWPALVLLRQRFPHHRLTAIGRPAYLKLAVELKIIDAWYDCESPEMLPFFTGVELPVQLVGTDTAILWLSSGETTSRLLAKRGIHVLLTAPFPPQPMHVACYHVETIARFCRLPSFNPAKFSLTGWSLSGKPLVLIHPGSGSKNKNYAPSMYLELIAELKKRGHGDVRFVLGPAEDGLIPAFAGQPIERPDSITTLAGLLQQSQLYIGNDSGVSHLAGVLGVPSVVLYKNTDPAIWGVLGPRVCLLKADDDATVLSSIIKIPDFFSSP